MPPRRRPPAKKNTPTEQNVPEQEAPVTGVEKVHTGPSNTIEEQSSSLQRTESHVTEPAITSGTVPAKRLDSLTRPSSSNPTQGNSLPALKPKFVGRRSQAARAELEGQEAKKKAAEAAAAAKAAAAVATASETVDESKRNVSGGGHERIGRGGSRGGRGRGGYIGETQHPRHVRTRASGPFSAGQISQEAKKNQPRRSRLRSGGDRADGVESGPASFGEAKDGISSKVSVGTEQSMPVTTEGKTGVGFGKASDVATGGVHTIKTEDGGYISSDEDEAEQLIARKNIDDLQSIVDLTAGDDDPFAPVRLRRIPRKDRTVELRAEARQTTRDAMTGVESADATTEKQEGKRNLDGIEITGSNARVRRDTTYSSSSEADPDPPIKAETAEGGDLPRLQTADRASTGTTEIPNADSPSRANSSPGRKRRGKQKAKVINATMEDSYFDDDDDATISEIPKFHTSAETEEWEQHHADLRLIRSELGRQVPRNSQTDLEKDGSATRDHATVLERAKSAEAVREGHMYLFQFPPVLPDLNHPSVKPDPDAIVEQQAETAMDIDQGTTMTEGLTSLKKETEPDTSQSGTTRPKLPSGSIGKLKIHKSGKATLDWGGTSFSLGMGTETTFLQNILMAQVPESKPETNTASQSVDSARGMGMGQVRGKFVLTPNWDELLK